MDMRFGTWNVRSLYRSGSLKTVARELGNYKLDLVGVQEVRWDKGGSERSKDYTFFYGAGNEDKKKERSNVFYSQPPTKFLTPFNISLKVRSRNFRSISDHYQVIRSLIERL
jgi:exonuclease III